MAKITFSLPTIKADKLSPDNYSLSAVVYYSSMAGLSGHLLFLIMFAITGVNQLAIINVGSCLIFLFCFLANQRGHTHLAMLVGGVEVIGHAVVAVLFLGWESGFHYYILAVVPLTFYSQTMRNMIKILLAAALLGIYLSLYIFSHQAPPWINLEAKFVLMFVGVNIAIVFGIFAILSHFYRANAFSAEKALRQANQKLEIQAQTDPLTKLMNRRSITFLIEREVDEFIRFGQPFSIILGDVDNFKKFNDTFGHEIGDHILVEVAELLKNNIREQDYVSRWGGEEFLVLLPRLDQAGARQVAERIRESIAAHPMAAGGGTSQITMTFGVATYSGYSEAKECIRRADMAMYDGKRQGRNCVIVNHLQS